MAGKKERCFDKRKSGEDVRLIQKMFLNGVLLASVMSPHFNYHRGVGPNIPENDILVFPSYDNAGKLIGIGAWITSTEVSRQTGFSQELSSYIKDGRIKFVWVDGRRYFFQK